MYVCVMNVCVNEDYTFNNNNTLSLAIQTKRMKIITKILEANAKPEYMSLNHAIMTNNLEIVKIAIQNGAKPLNTSEEKITSIYNTLSLAIDTANPDIVFEIIANAGTMRDSIFHLDPFVGLSFCISCWFITKSHCENITEENMIKIIK